MTYSFSVFERDAAPYRESNLMIDVLELHKIIRAGDGSAFDEHWTDMLAHATNPDEGHRARLLSVIEERAPRDYRPRPAARYPFAFALARSLALLPKEELVAFMMGPSGFALPEAQYPGWRGGDAGPSRAQFEEEHVVSFAELWEADLLDELANMVARAPFVPLNHESLGIDFSMRFAPLQALFHVLTSDLRLRQRLAQLCGLERHELARFSGRIYRMVPRRDADLWHNDVHAKDRRLIALSLYLEAPPPRGGTLLMRRAGFRRPFVRDVAKPRGTLTVFRIARDLEHKVGRVWSGARTNFAGWYLSSPGLAYRSRWLERPWFGRPSREEPWLRRLTAKR